MAHIPTSMYSCDGFAMAGTLSRLSEHIRHPLEGWPDHRNARHQTDSKNGLSVQDGEAVVETKDHT